MLTTEEVETGQVLDASQYSYIIVSGAVNCTVNPLPVQSRESCLPTVHRARPSSMQLDDFDLDLELTYGTVVSHEMLEKATYLQTKSIPL